MTLKADQFSTCMGRMSRIVVLVAVKASRVNLLMRSPKAIKKIASTATALKVIQRHHVSIFLPDNTASSPFQLKFRKSVEGGGSCLKAEKFCRDI